MSESMIRTLHKVTLLIEEPWAVGTVADTPNEVPILRDGQGAPYVPATGLVGSLRAHLNRIDAARTIELLDVGTPSAKPDAPVEEAPASRSDDAGEVLPPSTCLVALGTRVDHAPEVLARSTAIDPWSRTARSGSLRTERFVGATARNPTRVTWYLEEPVTEPDHGDQESDSAEHERAQSVVDAVRSWCPVIGRRRTSGRGSARVERIDSVTVDLKSPDHLTWWLTTRHAWLAGDIVDWAGDEPSLRTVTGETSASSVWDWELSFRVEDAVHVGTGEDGGVPGDESKPLRVLREGTGSDHECAVIPGTSWKGVFRARATHIARLVGMDDAEQRVARLFGSAPGHDADDTGTRGILRFGNSPFADSTFFRTHVAIDRFTGGARDGALFRVEAVPHGAASTVRITADATLDEVDEQLLAWVVRDFDDAMIGVGGMTSRGYGSIRFDNPPPVRPFTARRPATTGVPS